MPSTSCFLSGVLSEESEWGTSVADTLWDGREFLLGADGIDRELLGFEGKVGDAFDGLEFDRYDEGATVREMAVRGV